ncbi:calpain-A-like [Diadema antillarum]|uniref:calpain-A-like n=1 Tax=Diadema antillarum TaxID=105358 RepID=UPI003A869517
MGSSSSLCGGADASRVVHPTPRRPRLRSRTSHDLGSRPLAPPPYDRHPPSTHGGYVPPNSYAYSHHAPPVITPNDPPPPYESPQRQPPTRVIVNRDVATAVRARPNVVDEPGDLWLDSELPPLSIEDDDEDFDNGDDVEDFDAPPDGHLVFASFKNFETFCNNFVSSRGNQLFEDPDFRAEADSIYAEGSGDASGVRWMRPHELCAEPGLIVDGISRRDVVQGVLGDCWFLAPLSAIAKVPHLIERVVPLGQSFDEGYTGMFRFRFWRFGRWVSVVVDDRLPTRNGRLIFARSSDSDEFWPSLVEKAYAKLHGSYSGLAGGMAADSFVDLTGGLAEVYDLNETTADDLYGILYRGTRSGAFMCCSRKGDWRANETNNLGIVTGHSYSIHRVQTGMLKGGNTVRLVQIRNPWANSTEWKGKWSDSSTLWKNVLNREDFEDDTQSISDGEFWMSYTDFVGEFTKIVISTVGPDFDGDGIPDVVNDTARGFHLVTRNGSWMRGVNAGGCQNYIQQGFHTNPQIMITLLEPDEWTPDRGTSSHTRGSCSLIITLLQEYRRVRNKHRAKKHQIGYVVYKVESTDRALTKNDLMYMQPVGSSSLYINHREVLGRFNLHPGHYCVIPSTFKPNISLRFMTRIFTEKPILCSALQTG